MNRSLLTTGVFLASLMALLCLTPACDKQAQGERCDQLNGNDDCVEGLVCTPGSQVGQKKDVCCPSSLADATDPRCTQGGGQVGGAGGGGGSTGGTGGSTTSSTGGTTGGTGGSTGGTTTTTSSGGTGGTGGTGGMN